MPAWVSRRDSPQAAADAYRIELASPSNPLLVANRHAKGLEHTNPAISASERAAASPSVGAVCCGMLERGPPCRLPSHLFGATRDHPHTDLPIPC